MAKVFSVNCEHIADIKPGNMEFYHFVLETDEYKMKLEKDWKFCPVCGKPIEFAAES